MFPIHRPPSSSRSDAVASVMRWLGTPYVLRGRVRGAGCDCGTIIAEYLIENGVAHEGIDLEFYSDDWFCHASDERYLVQLGKRAQLMLETICRGTVAEALPGTIALFRAVGSKRYNHGAIVTAWPWGVHAVHPAVEEVDLTQHILTGFQEMALFDPWGGND